jgi:hypothetical protein
MIARFFCAIVLVVYSVEFYQREQFNGLCRAKTTSLNPPCNFFISANEYPFAPYSKTAGVQGL